MRHKVKSTSKRVSITGIGFFIWMIWCNTPVAYKDRLIDQYPGISIFIGKTIWRVECLIKDFL